MNRRNILFVSSVPWGPRSLGQPVRLFAPWLRAEGFDLTVLPFEGVQHAEVRWQHVRVLPAGETAHQWLQRTGSRPDGVVVVGQPHHHRALGGPWNDGPPVAAWFPVDSRFTEYVETSRSIAGMVWSMTRWGRDALGQAGVSSEYVPLGIDTNVFRPDSEARRLFRDRAGLDGRHRLVVMVAVNYPGNLKGFDRALSAFAALRRTDPHVRLYLHTDADGSLAGGPDLIAAAAALGLGPPALGWSDPTSYRIGWPDTEMAALYNAADVVLVPSAVEGFCLPAVEAQACGTPVVSSSVWPLLETNPLGPHVAGFWQGMYFRPRVQGLVEALGSVLAEPPDRDSRVDVASSYSAEKVFRSHLLPALHELVD